METLLSQTLLPTRDHALPFRVMFEEALRCRPHRLHAAVATMLSKVGPATVTDAEANALLLEALEIHENAYEELQRNSDEIARGNPDAPKRVDKLLEACADADRPLKSILHAMDISALCLSGGGIRSASFGLGLLEALALFSTNGGAADGLLNQIDYLSTVSGGGYIGSWLMAWVYRRWAAAGSATCKTSYEEVVSALAGQSAVTGGDPEPAPIRHLRSYTSFLAPAIGLTLDAFTLAAIVLRNLLVNWVMLLPVLFSLAALAQTSGYLLMSVRRSLEDGNLHPYLRVSLGAVFMCAALAAGAALPSHNRKDPTAPWRKTCVTAFLGLVLVGCWLLAVYPVPGLGRNHSQVRQISAPTQATSTPNQSQNPPASVRPTNPRSPDSTQNALTWLSWQRISSMFFMGIFGYGTLSFFMWRAYSRRVDEMTAKHLMQLPFMRLKSTVAVLMTIATLLTAFLVSSSISLLQVKVFPAIFRPTHWQWLNYHVGSGLFATFCVPLIIAVLAAATSIFCALLGLFEQEEDREWWVRVGGQLIIVTLGWIIVHGLLFFGPTVWHRFWISAAGLVLGFAGSIVGYSGITAAGAGVVKSAQLTSTGKFLQKHNLVLPTVAATAILLITLGVMTLAQKLNLALQDVLYSQMSWLFPAGVRLHGWRAELIGAIVLFLFTGTLMVLANLAININLFSLHGMYRMRLMRAFLGASNVARRPDPFTGFDPDDTPLETDLPSQEGVPLHVISTTLNLVGTTVTAWQQRRAESFTFSPVVSGGWRVGYLPTHMYGGVRGVSLSTSLSISGAAFNPNMGYQSSSLLSLLMTFFNLRLGYWLPNPKWVKPKKELTRKDRSFLGKSGPGFALEPLLQEALGDTNDSTRWIELTDGGHFENLALYEMVMRRCKLIVLMDASADSRCLFEDLGNAIRKIQIDLGVPIVFPDGVKMKGGFKDENKYCAVGRIEYQYADDPGPGQKTEDMVGYLIYIKPGLNGSEPIDVQQYAKVHNTFPHEATANQFFEEPQFESYRNLAFHEVMTIANSVDAGMPMGSTLRDLLEAAHNHTK